jgi:hypothetical protein
MIEHLVEQPWMREVNRPVHIDLRWWPPHVPYPTHCIYPMPAHYTTGTTTYFTHETVDPPRTVDFEEATNE